MGTGVFFGVWDFGCPDASIRHEPFPHRAEFLKRMWRNWLRGQLDEIEKQGLYRRRKVVEGPQGPEVNADGRRLVNFCSNDYLGLANHPVVAYAFRQAIGR